MLLCNCTKCAVEVDLLIYWKTGLLSQQAKLMRVTAFLSNFYLCSDLDSRLAYPRPRPRPRLAYPRPRPRPRLSSSKTKTKTLMSKTKTETQDLQDQYWKFMTGINCDKQKDCTSHGKQKIQHTGSCTE